LTGGPGLGNLRRARTGAPTGGIESELDTVSITVNGRETRHRVDARTLLVHYLRNVLGLTGTHVGCDSSQCGACTVLLDGLPVKSCSVLAVQADGSSVDTVEGLAPDGERLHPVQQAFQEEHGLQCGFCTPGVLMTTVALLRENPEPDEAEVRRALSGNLCRCTGYENIVRSILRAARADVRP
jgi:carbon-monoxide dehydrogenase small subunit